MVLQLSFKSCLVGQNALGARALSVSARRMQPIRSCKILAVSDVNANSSNESDASPQLQKPMRPTAGRGKGRPSASSAPSERTRRPGGRGGGAKGDNRKFNGPQSSANSVGAKGDETKRQSPQGGGQRKSSTSGGSGGGGTKIDNNNRSTNTGNSRDNNRSASNSSNRTKTSSRPGGKRPGLGGNEKSGRSKPAGGSPARQSGSGNSNRRSPQKRSRAVDIDSRRKSRQSRRAERQQEALASAPQRQDIFEVGPEGMSVEDLADMLAVPPVDIVKKLFMKGLAVQVNSTLDAETVKAVGMEYEVDVIDRDDLKPEDAAKKSREFIEEADLDHLENRPPVVTVMGHVDHGKTSLLDFVRNTKVAAGEAGGITQSIGAYTCDVNYAGEVRQVTFLDTPGHEAFSAMRARGAKVTDIAIIIVAADDGVRPQTLEAISHARAAGVPIVVAINKCDKEGANPERVKQELTEVELVPEEWGGKTPMVNISAKKGKGVDDLLETVLLVAELEELQARRDRQAVGTVLEAVLDKKVGPLSTVLVQNGTLRIGDAIAAGSSYGKVRSMTSLAGEVDSAGPSIAVQLLGLNSVPQAGDEFEVFESESRAREAAEAVEDARRLERLAEMAGGGSMVTLSSLASMDDDSEEQTLQRMNIILKADASGSCEAVKAALSALPQDTVVLRYLLAAPGEITVSDIDLATASGGMVLGFGVSPSESVTSAAKNSGVTLGIYKVIYDLVDDVRAAMEGRLRTAQERVKIGEAEVKAVFGSGSRKVAGCVVTDGALRRDALVIVKRGKRIVFEGSISSLRRVKDDVKEVTSGVECGVGVEGFRDWQPEDVIEAYEMVEKKLKLEEAQAATIEF